MGTGCSTGDRQAAVRNQGAAGPGSGAGRSGAGPGFDWVKSTKAYIRSMRLYYSFVTGIAGWLGVAYYEHLAGDPALRTIEVAPAPEKKLLILVILFLSWGVNQIVNDYLGLKEDRINAPARPMVTGELNPRLALLVSAALMVISGVITWFYLQPVAVLFLAGGVLLNILYEYAKARGILGNLVFGLMITMAPLYGGYASGPTAATVFESNRISVLLLVLVLNALMTYYTYFKDYRGDLLAGKRTLVVVFGLEKSRWIAVASALIPTIVFGVLRATGLHQGPLNNTFIILGVLTVFLQIWTGVLYWKNPSGVKAYASLETNFRACTCGQAALIAMFNPDLGIWLFIFSYILVGFLFDLHRNPKE
jgi:geranylgeranylglycerol-phosphate geranylgeranyltransferase